MSAGTTIAVRLEPLGRLRSRPWRRPRVAPRGAPRLRRRRASARCGRGSAAARRPGSRPSASRPAKSRQDLTWALATGISYSMPCSGAPRDLQRRQPLLAAARGRRPSRAAGPRSRSTGRRRIESSPSSVQLAAVLPGEPARQQPQQGAGVADVDRRRARRRAGRRRADPQRAVAQADRDPTRRLHLRRPSAQRRPRPGSSGCRRRRGSPRSASPPPPIAAISAARWEIDLSAGGRREPRSGPEGSKRVIAAALLPGAEHGDRVAELADQRRGAARPARRRRPRARPRRRSCREPGRAPCPRC